MRVKCPHCGEVFKRGPMSGAGSNRWRIECITCGRRFFIYHARVLRFDIKTFKNIDVTDTDRIQRIFRKLRIDAHVGYVLKNLSELVEALPENEQGDVVQKLKSRL